MIINPVNIVGCGTIGSCLALELARGKLISELNLFDYDVINENPSYPFLKKECGIHKTKLIEFLCKKINPYVTIKSYLEKITNPLKFQSFTIDCRDSKETNIGAQVRISLDGSIMYIDSIKRSNTEKDYYRYIAPRNEVYINKAINIICQYTSPMRKCFCYL